MRIYERGSADGEELIGGGDDNRNAAETGEQRWWFHGGFEPFFRRCVVDQRLL